MQNIARFAKAASSRAAVPVAAGVVATAAQPVAQADCSHRDELHAVHRRIHDDWELADFDKDVVLFKAEDIDNALSILIRKGPSAVVEELDSDCSSDGTADAVLGTCLPYMAPVADDHSLPLDVQDICSVAARLLKSPGVQREICAAALSDPEVFDILASKTDLPQYLESAGFSTRGLLECPEATAEDVQNSITGPFAAVGSSNNLLLQLSAKAAGGIEQLGHAVARLGSWMRLKLTGEEQANRQFTRSSNGTSAGSQHSQRAQRVGDTFLGSVMIVCVAVVALLVLRKPVVLRGMFKRRAAA